MDKDEVLRELDSIAARLDGLDGLYYWGDEIEKIKKFIESCECKSER